MNYGKALRVARAVAGLQQKDLAELSGIDSSHVCLIELGKRNPSVEVLDKICKALKMPKHLLMLLGTEAEDLNISDPKELHRAAESLAFLLFRNAPKPRRQSARRPS